MIVHIPGGWVEMRRRALPEGELSVHDTYQWIMGESEHPVGSTCTLREAFLNGQPVPYPRSRQLAEKAGLA